MSHQIDQFPFRRVLSLGRLVSFWRERAASDNPIEASQARVVLEHAEKIPALFEDEIDPEVLEKYPHELALLMSAITPPAAMDTQYMAAFPPFLLSSFFSTRRFDDLGIEEKFNTNVQVTGVDMTDKDMERGKAMKAYLSILNHVYGIGQEFEHPFIYTRHDDQTGLEQYYKLGFDMQFVSIVTKDPVPELSEEQAKDLFRDPMNLERWAETLPPEHFEFHGFVTINAIEVTVPQAISALRNDLLQKDAMTSPERVAHLEHRVRILLRKPDVRLGLIGLERSEFDAITGARAIGHSLLLSDTLPACRNKKDSYYAQVFHSGQEVVVEDLEQCESLTGFEHRLLSAGLRNLLVAPLHYEDKLIGLVELASPNPGDLNQVNSAKLMEVAHLFATAMNRSLEEREDRLQAVIKKQYTAVHPAVEWRFREAAVNFLNASAQGGRVELEPIVFEDVHPLYGLSDIRGSSTQRMASIQADLVEQMSMALNVLVKAGAVKSLPVLDEMGFRLEKYITEIKSGLRSGDESAVVDFLRNDVEKMLVHVATLDESIASSVEAYRELLDPKLGLLYRKRRDFEDSVMRINETISRFLDEQEEWAQSMFPHYFERYQTDGVDYNIYVGESILETGKYDPLYLRNLRLWQLMTTCGIAWEMNELIPQLPIPLETAHLILVQSVPLSIRFRYDEKRFDVDGAYNARYEIVKKRIDKARVKGTGERLTQPGRIAVVYSQPRDEHEYEQYGEYLVSAGYLGSEVEHLEVEDLQGVSGLKAIRFTVAESAPNLQLQVTPQGEVKKVSSEKKRKPAPVV